MEFYSSGADESLGIYYNGKWIVNNDWAIDKSFDPEILNDPKLSTQDIIKKLVKPHFLNHVFTALFVP
ncbi:MAG: hypothetical protein GXP45_05670 [bacterium]|nr:hypothetical protein [bacterium]